MSKSSSIIPKLLILILFINCRIETIINFNFDNAVYSLFINKLKYK